MDFTVPYDFESNKPITGILKEAYFERTIALSASNDQLLDFKGDGGESSIWMIEIDKDINGTTVMKFKSTKTDKYLAICNDGTEINVSNDGDASSRFKLHKTENGKCKFESMQFTQKYLSAQPSDDDNMISTGSYDDKYAEFTVWTNEQYTSEDAPTSEQTETEIGSNLEGQPLKHDNNNTKDEEELPYPWSKVFTPDGKPYYQNTITKATQWIKPKTQTNKDQSQKPVVIKVVDTINSNDKNIINTNAAYMLQNHSQLTQMLFCWCCIFALVLIIMLIIAATSSYDEVDDPHYRSYTIVFFIFYCGWALLCLATGLVENDEYHVVYRGIVLMCCWSCVVLILLLIYRMTGDWDFSDWEPYYDDYSDYDGDTVGDDYSDYDDYSYSDNVYYQDYFKATTIFLVVWGVSFTSFCVWADKTRIDDEETESSCPECKYARLVRTGIFCFFCAVLLCGGLADGPYGLL